MKGSAAIRMITDRFTLQVKVTLSPGHANCLPSSSTLDERFTVTFEMGEPACATKEIKSNQSDKHFLTPVRN